MSSQLFSFKSIINGLSLPTLKELSIITFAIALLEEEEIKKIYIEHFSAEWVEDSFSHSTVCKLTCKLTSICKSLDLPETLQARVVSGFHWIGEQYFNYIQFVIRNLPQLQRTFPKKIDYITYIMNSVKWNMGVIDKQKSMHQIFLLKNEVKDDVTLSAMFQVASIFCIEDDLKMLWEKMSDAEKNYLDEYSQTCDFTFYWISEMNEDMRKWAINSPDYLNDTKDYQAQMYDKELCNYDVLVKYVLKGDISGVKYFIKITNIDVKDMAAIVRKFITQKIFLQSYQCADMLHVLLNEIKNEDILSEIFYQYFDFFLKITVKSWPWYKFFLPLLQFFADMIYQVLFYDLITQLLEDLTTEKSDISEVKILWYNTPREVRKSFCLYISNKQEDRDVRCFWENVTIEVLEIFLIDEELRNVQTPYENYGILAFILRGRYDLIDFWLEKCLVSEEAVISYFDYFIQTKSVEVMEILQKYPVYSLNRVNEFLDWAFKYEHFMNRDTIFKAKVQAIYKNIVPLFVRGIKFQKWEDLEKLIDWLIKKRNREYTLSHFIDKLVKWKLEAIEKLFLWKRLTFSNDFKNSLSAFLNYPANYSEKLKVVMRKVKVNEGEICSNYLKSDFALIDNYLTFLEEYGKNISVTKVEIFGYIFRESKETDFEGKKFCENIRKLLYWNCENDEGMKAELTEIKKLLISTYAVLNILKCVCNYWDLAMQNILKFLFEGKMEDEEWSLMLHDLKIKAVNQFAMIKGVWEIQEDYYMLIMLINWGKKKENIRKKNWEIKKNTMKSWLQHYIKAKIVPELILNWDFIRNFFEGDENMADFQKVLWYFKEYLVWKVISYDDNIRLICKLLENLKGFRDFLYWNGFDERGIENIKVKILKKGIRSCLILIETDKLHALSDLLNWCSDKSSFGDLNADILKFKRKVLDIVVSEYSQDWKEKYFEQLDEFLSMQSNGDEEELKIIVEKFAVKSV